MHKSLINAVLGRLGITADATDTHHDDNPETGQYLSDWAEYVTIPYGARRIDNCDSHSLTELS